MSPEERERLRPYLQHQADCNQLYDPTAVGVVVRNRDDYRCTCGLQALLDAFDAFEPASAASGVDEYAKAWRYALALMHDRANVEAPANAAAIRRYIEVLESAAPRGR